MKAEGREALQVEPIQVSIPRQRAGRILILEEQSDVSKKHIREDHNKLWEILQEMGIPDHLTS